MNLISVIVPIYKVERYLDRCITSIVNQTYKNLEIILVDDGSPDRCPQICDEWKKKDNRIKVIHKKNGGAGHSRNVALDIAQGDFITFVDSDDYLSLDMYETLFKFFNINKQIDIVECNYISVYNDYANFSLEDLKYKIYDKEEALIENINGCYFKQVIWNKIYKREVLSNIRFPENKKIDDEFFTYKVIANSKKLIHIDVDLYAYRIQPNSVMHSLNLSTKFHGVEARIERQEYLDDYFPNLSDIGVVDLYFSCMYLGQQCLADSSRLSNEIFKKLILTINKYKIRNLNRFDLKNIFWLVLARKSLKLTCYLRNKLKVGL